MTKRQGKKKAPDLVPALRPTFCAFKPLAADLGSSARLRPAQFENEDEFEDDDMYVDEEKERAYTQEEDEDEDEKDEEEEMEEQDDSGADTSSSSGSTVKKGASLPPLLPLKIFIPQKRNKQPETRKSNSKYSTMHIHCLHCIRLSARQRELWVWVIYCPHRAA